MMTVDWNKWMNATPAEQRAMWQRYKDIVKAESLDFRRPANIAKFEEALRDPHKFIKRGGE
jgi:hypothetical protein